MQLEPKYILKMNRYVVLCLMLFLISCRTNKKKIVDANNVEIEYVIDSSLTTNLYEDDFGYFPKEGMVPTPEVAIGIAKSVWTGIYGNKLVEKEKPYSINLEDNIWIVEGTLVSNNQDQIILGGTLYIEIDKRTGNIIKVFHSK